MNAHTSSPHADRCPMVTTSLTRLMRDAACATDGVFQSPRHFYSPIDLARMEAEILSKAHAFLIHEGHPTSAGHLQPLVRAARNAVMAMEGARD